MSPAAAVPYPAPVKPGLHFTEKMAGFMSTKVTEGYGRGYRQGRADGSLIEFVLTIRYEDLQAVLMSPAHTARLSGTVVAPELSPHRLTVEGGEFQLMVRDTTHVETWHMWYRMTLRTEEGRRYGFSGFKLLRERSGLYTWMDTTTLFLTLTDEQGTKLGVGVMRIRATDFLRQLTTMRIDREPDVVRRVLDLGRFGRMFATSLFHIYGGELDFRTRFPNVSDTPPTPPPPVGDVLPEVRWRGADPTWHANGDLGRDAWLRLTRYRGGTKGPVVLAGGFAMSIHSFLIETIDTNLTEYLVDRGYDVWLLDYRASRELPSAATEFSLDDIAREDWPEAVKEVRRVTEAETVQAFGHCVASVTLQMALASGMQGVRSAVCGQFTLFPVGSLLNRVKAYLHVGDLMTWAGLKVVGNNTMFDVPNVLLDLLLRPLPLATEERCGLAECRWINAIYGCTHRHAQLNDATHEALPGMFGVGNVRALRHLSRMTRRARAVTFEGGNDYLQHPERLAIPILFLHGDRNYIFMPEGSARTLRRLRRKNGRGLYRRVVLKGYAHLDTIIGRNAARDVFPHIVEHFDRTVGP
jgi:pimeloyl-ACP methyl ester carboxylesterase